MAQPRYRSLRSANDEFQLLRALINNRTKRRRQERFLVQGVRLIDCALASGWPMSSLLVAEEASSSWARQLVRDAPVPEVIRLPTALLHQLSQRDEGAEVVGVAKMQERGITTVSSTTAPIVIAEAVQSPGNLGTMLRSIDALGGGGLIITGHAADPYDPQSVRASVGALFSVPFAEVGSVAEVAETLHHRVIGLDPEGELIDDVDLAGPLFLVAGNEEAGLSTRARALCQSLVQIPMTGAMNSLNIATAVAIVLAEIARRRRRG